MKFINLNKVGLKDTALVGGKSASLGEMIQKLPHINIPGGFCITTEFYEHFIKTNNLKKTIEKYMKKIDYENTDTIKYYSNLIRLSIINGKIDDTTDINEYYSNLGDNVDVAIRSSSTAEDLESASFAGQQETFLNIRGTENVIQYVKKCFASLYTERAIVYRKEINYNKKLDISVCVQKMVRSDLGCSGVAFSLCPESGYKDVIIVNGSYGLGESVVQGEVVPDEFIVYKKTLVNGYDAIIDKKLGKKNCKTVYNDEGIKKVHCEDNKTFCLNDYLILQISYWIIDIEQYYKKFIDMEWAYDGEKMYVVQARPETVHSNKITENCIIEYKINSQKQEPLLTGIAVGNRISSGKVKIVDSVTNYEQTSKFQKGDILVTDITDPDWEPLMRNASAIITNKGGRTCFSGDTMVLTNYGILEMSQIFKMYQDKQSIYTPSLNRETRKIEWMPIVNMFNQVKKTVRVHLDTLDNNINVTLDHKMVVMENGKINDASVLDLIKSKTMCLCLKKLTRCENTDNMDILNISKDEAFDKLQEIINYYKSSSENELIINNTNTLKTVVILCLRLGIKYNIKQNFNYVCKLETIDNTVFYNSQMHSNLIELPNVVYNLTVEKNHNYIVFTKNFTPIIVNNCHASIIARELGINALVGTNNGTLVLESDKEVTVSCAEGEIGKVYSGKVDYEKHDTNIGSLPKISTKIMFNIASPHNVFKYANYPIQGVGLVRQEFIINNYIKVHPLALLNYSSLDKELQKRIDDTIDLKTTNYKNYYIDKLSYGIARIAATFWPRDVIVRFSDFKSNEYKNLLGGHLFEPDEENPMIGWRGASRYYSKNFIDAFTLECEAIIKVRELMGLNNVIVMIPFCRTVQECKTVTDIMASVGLKRQNGLKVYIMCEIPSNVVLASKFCKYVDGFSIGSNDLTQLTLGLDRDSSLVSHLYNENDPSVKYMIKKAIKKCKKNGTKIGICGQGPSDSAKFAEFLVKNGIDSVSIVPDSLVNTINTIAKVENKLKQQKNSTTKVL